MNNKDIIFNIVEKHFSLNRKSLSYFKNQLYEPEIDEFYKNLLGDSKDLRRSFPLKEENYEAIDKGWNEFLQVFSYFVKKYNVKYDDFRNGKIKVDSNTIKIRKLLIKFYTENERFAASDDLRCRIGCSCTNNDIIYNIDSKLNFIGSIKLPMKELKVVLSLNFADWFLCSTAESWNSCLHLGSNGYTYWTGLPGLIGDKNRAMIYLTDGKKKAFEGITVDKILSRSWILLNNRNIPSIVRWYPQRFFKIKAISKILKIDLSILDNNFVSKRPIVPLFFKNNYSAFIYQDGSKFDNNLHIVGRGRGGGGIFCFEKHKLGKSEFITEEIFDYAKGLIKLIETKTSILEENNEVFYCSECNDSLEEDEVFDSCGRVFCEECFYERVKVCNCCASEIYITYANFIKEENKYFCNECFIENFIKCDKCKRFINKKHISKENKHIFVCNECFIENFIKCDKCEKFIDKLFILKKEDKHICINCKEKEIPLKKFKYIDFDSLINNKYFSENIKWDHQIFEPIKPLKYSKNINFFRSNTFYEIIK